VYIYHCRRLRLCYIASLHVYNEQMIHDGEADVEVTRLKVEKAREKVAQLKLALRAKRDQTKGCSLSKLFVCFTHTVIFVVFVYCMLMTWL